MSLYQQLRLGSLNELWQDDFEWRGMWQKASIANFNIVSLYLFGDTEWNHENQDNRDSELVTSRMPVRDDNTV
jgi:uncharacterized protein YfdQ (DUF2303 family)